MALRRGAVDYFAVCSFGISLSYLALLFSHTLLSSKANARVCDHVDAY